jgi:hypothetical protein
MVFFFCFPRSPSGVNGDVIHIYGEPSLSHLFTKDGVHHYLERGGGVGEAKKHHHGFEEPFWSEEGSFPFVPWLNSDVVVSPADVELCEEGIATKVVDCLRDQGRNIAISFCPFVHRSVVLYRAQFSILPFDEEKVGGIGAPQLADCTPFQMLGYELVGLHYFVLLQW